MKYRGKNWQVKFWDWLFGSLARKNSHSRQAMVRVLDKREIDHQWRAITALSKQGGEVASKQAVISADNLLDKVLRNLGVKGENTGKRLINAQRLLGNSYQKAWDAHKLRNRIVHEQGEYLSFETGQAIAKYKEVLKKLGAL